MNCSSIPGKIAQDWNSRLVTHTTPHERVPQHYHDVEEWLYVQRGEATFYAAGGQKAHIVGDRPGLPRVLHIPRGEVHRVEIGAAGVDYVMWLSEPRDESTFSNILSDEEVSLVNKNLLIPQREEDADHSFFDSLLSEQLIFRRADGSIIDKERFLANFSKRARKASDSVRILSRTPEIILVSTSVTMPSAAGALDAFLNERLFVKENGVWKCRVWWNSRESTDS